MGIVENFLHDNYITSIAPYPTQTVTLRCDICKLLYVKGELVKEIRAYSFRYGTNGSYSICSTCWYFFSKDIREIANTEPTRL